MRHHRNVDVVKCAQANHFGFAAEKFELTLLAHRQALFQFDVFLRRDRHQCDAACQVGRDLLSRMIYGARVSMLVGLGAQVIVVAIGVPLGALSGYLGGRVDLYLMRVVDVMYAFPNLLFVILVMSMLGAGLTNIFIAIGLTGWVGIARQTRAQVLAIKEKEYIEAARGMGARFARMLGRHVLPNALTPIVVAVSFGIPQAIFTEAALSFIGVGINPPTPSWGQMVGEGQQYLRTYLHLSIFPSIAIAITMLSFTFLGDGIRDALDPKLK